MITAVCSFVIWATYISNTMIVMVPSSTHETLAACQKEVDDLYKQQVGIKGLIISYKCLPGTIDPRK